MADYVEQAEIRGLSIDKTIKGIAEIVYSFKDDLEVSPISTDGQRWYQETAGTLTATSPMNVANIAELAPFVTLEKSWTRNTLYTRKYGAEDFISEEDIRTADIDVMVRTLRALTLAVLKQIDTRIYNVITNSMAGVTAATTDVNLVTSSGSWTDGSNSPIWDLLKCQEMIFLSGSYAAEKVTVWLHPTDHVNLKNWLISAKGSSIPQYASGQMEKGAVGMLFGGMTLKVSPNCTVGKPVMLIPKLCGSWKTGKGLTTDIIDDPGIGKKIRVHETGEAILTAPKSVCILSGAA